MTSRTHPVQLFGLDSRILTVLRLCKSSSLNRDGIFTCPSCSEEHSRADGAPLNIERPFSRSMRSVATPILENYSNRPADIVDTTWSRTTRRQRPIATQSIISCHMINSDQSAAGLLDIMASTEGGLSGTGQIDADAQISISTYRRKLS